MTNYFGHCPECEGEGYHVAVYPNEWFACDDCRTRWCAGSGLISSCSDRTEAEMQAAWALVADYRIVEPEYEPIDADLRDELVAALAGIV